MYEKNKVTVEVYKKMILHMLENASERQIKDIYVFVLNFLF